jgi:hypothetical protein
MKPDAAVFAELRAASSREYSRFPVVYDLDNPWMILLPHLSKIKQTVQRLNLEACAELAAGQSDQALADVKLMLALADSIKSEPFLISYLVRVACVHIAIQPVWEGLAEHRWTDAQLQELQARFSSYDFLGDSETSLKTEHAHAAQWVDAAKKVRGLGVFGAIIAPDGYQEPFDKTILYLIGRVMPSGWYDQEKLNYSLLFDERMKGVANLPARTISPRTALHNESELIGKLGSLAKAILNHRSVARILLRSVGNVPDKAAIAQTAADQAALACALERYRLANGQFPETLAALSPQFMAHAPNDVITGEPFKYRRTEDGQFILYSVGWDDKDDGGVPGKNLFDVQGDWVWSYPAK